MVVGNALEGRKNIEGTESKTFSVLLIEDNLGDVRLLEEILSEAKSSTFMVQDVSLLSHGLKLLAEGRFDVLLLDLGLPDSYGLDTLQKVLRTVGSLPVVVLTGSIDEQLGIEAMKLGAQDYLVKGRIDSYTIERSIYYAIERKRASEALRESDDRYVSLFKDNHAVMLLIDPVSGDIVDANNAACEFYGYDRSVLVSMRMTQINNIQTDGLFRDMGKAASKDQMHFFFQHRLADDSLRDVEVYSCPLYFHGKMLLYSIIYDITDKVRAERERELLIQENDEQRILLQTVINNAPAGIVVISGEEFRIKWVNEAYRSYLDEPFKSMDLMGQRLTDVLPAEGVEGVKDLVRTVFRTNKALVTHEFEFKGFHRGPTYWQIGIVPIPGQGEQPDLMAMLVETTDLVKSRKRIEELAVRTDQEKRRLKTIIDTLPVGVSIADTSGKVVEMNHMVNSIWGGRAPYVGTVGESREFKAWWADTGISLRAEDWAINKAVKRGETIIGEVLDIQRFDGTRATILHSAAPIRDGEGNIIGGVSVVQDLTSQRKLEHDAIEAKQQAELYIDLLSHDISNMNASVSGYLQLALERMDIEEKNKPLFTKPLEILETSNRLIDMVRKIQQIDTNENRHSLVDLGWLLEEVRSEYEHFPGREVKIEYKTSLKKFVAASELLRDVFSNIVGNAIKHSKGEVEIQIILTKVFEDGREYYKVAVEDNGPGIPDEIKSKLFQRKQRGKTKASGTGLGLYLVKKLVEDFNGRVWVEDRLPGDHTKGTRFVVLLPASTALDARTAMKINP